MAGDWITIQHATPDKPEVGIIAETLGIDIDAVVGKLLRVWIWADQQTYDGNAGSVTRALLDRVTGVAGFANAMIEAGWLIDSEGGLLFPNFDRHNGETSKRRALTNKRVQKHRAERNAKCNASSVTDSVTKTLPEKRREEYIKEGTNVPSVDRVDGEEALTERIPKSGAEKDRDREIEAETRKIVDAWNQLPGARSIRSLNHKRRAAVRSRLLAGDWPWREAMDKFPLRCFESSDGYIPTFDFFVRPDTVNSILEGKYDWEHESGSSTSHKQAGAQRQRNFQAAVGFVRRHAVREESDETLALEGQDEPVGRVG